MAIDKWEFLGKHFGYPACCIATFHSMTGAMGNPLGAKASQGTGFIPCPTCAQKVLDGQIWLEDLITERQHSKPFPNDNEGEALKAFEDV